MPFEKGHKKVGGKVEGSQNKSTKDIKEAYRLLIEKNLDNLTGWLEQIASKDPEKAIRIINDLSEYVIPKLARQEMTGKDGKELFTVGKIEYIVPNDNNSNKANT